MIDDDDVRAAFADACSSPWPAAPIGEALGPERVRRLLPHRPPFLFVDRAWVHPEAVVATFDLAACADVFAGHFPSQPRWPGVLQVEAVAQAGLLLHAWQVGAERDEFALTHVLGARFVRSVLPGPPVTVVARCFEIGLFVVAVGQVLQHGALCSAAVTQVL